MYLLLFHLSSVIQQGLVYFILFCSRFYSFQSKQQEANMEMDKYDMIEMIGSGSYGIVYRAKEKATNRNIAMKLIKKVSFQICKKIILQVYNFFFCRHRIPPNAKKKTRKDFSKNVKFIIH